VRDVFIGEWDSGRPTPLSRNERLRDGKGAIRRNKRARNICDQIPAVPARQALFATFFSRGHRSWHPASTRGPSTQPPAAVRGHPLSDSSPNRANKQPQRDVERQLWHIIYIHTHVSTRDAGGQFAFIFGMVIRGEAIIITILRRPACSDRSTLGTTEIWLQ